MRGSEQSSDTDHANTRNILHPRVRHEGQTSLAVSAHGAPEGVLFAPMRHHQIAAVFDSSLMPFPRMVMLAIAGEFQPHQTDSAATVSLSTISKKTGLTRSSVARHIEDLEAKGALEVDRSKRRNSYRITLENYGRPEDAYRLRRQAADEALSKAELRRLIFERDGNQCVRCGASADLCLDHIISVKRGGGDTPDNLQCLCRSCNSRKGTRCR